MLLLPWQVISRAQKGRGDYRSLMERNRVEDGEASLGFSTEESSSCLASTVYNTFLEFDRVMLSAPPPKKAGGVAKVTPNGACRRP